MTKKEICIVIPIYKECLNEYEIQSLKQCLAILYEYAISFVAPAGLNLEFYKLNFTSINKYTFFDKSYFKDIAGYNRLLLSPFFYKKFKNYEYMLIYQTDCYVFKDELLEWANKGYDYIGGIWFEGYHGNPFAGAKMWQAGNGGLSLRKIKTMCKVLNSNKRLKNRVQLLEEKKLLGKVKGFKAFEVFVLYFLKIFGYKNSLRFYAHHYNENEDVFFMSLSSKYGLISIPTVENALFFSWDRHPNFLFKQLGKLPFACHAYCRDDRPYEGNKEFWFAHIEYLKQ